MNRQAAVLILLSTLVACDRSAYPGYKSISNDVYVKLLKVGDEETTPTSGDSVLLRWRASRWEEETGSLMSSERWYAVDDLGMAMFQAVLPRSHVGDSMSVITRSALIPWSILVPEADPADNDTVMVRIELTARSLLTVQAQAERREARRKADPERYEARLVQAFLDTATAQWQRWGTSALYYWIDSGPVGGDSIRQGDLITIHYEGRSLEDGRIFDDTERSGQPLTYRVGDPDQVIEGLAVAVSLLKAGCSGAFVIPSSLAFGARGVGGSLPPYSPVHYRVAVEKLHRDLNRRSEAS
ncbi:MAG: FKBP-type peptidyl-prolyl cis-trans isomerase [Flavobacteriales bacterium]|nr:FKBP-type peptidyl-prolyl cis-trans isomerase [Flavobacteriales bacterium]MBK7752267.1 FKBP-type peptidyl-prolyl cis-trans isomerase [Flavobacteriales bacterium]MBK9537787.1 FKBP-type peptidyl-prolyl cis-trans isomerase [Flavobacteriales bacterium]